MTPVTMGIDIGTFESKGVLVDTATGALLAEARRPHEMQVPQPGWAEHRAEEDWWAPSSISPAPCWIAPACPARR
ncbi:Sugar (pentulose and hexulose) kinase [Rubellimicrobium thermophilum DSM 16684]|uniref:Sugar (Pentulose and hexulose) kinase n=1 Tax=Rubellimicrobium thermophilum DSM 16684 TaxID=1123069 RepID=S9SLB3_9RHOB|nr:FGGY family carbohydrate kinase [Rubellimicrobium thermophilum]EPX87159.1 Sugar (pentulose and hexulose) kinase [Rubellimicrobium thermophilum DSM 16684]